MALLRVDVRVTTRQLTGYSLVNASRAARRCYTTVKMRRRLLVVMLVVMLVMLMLTMMLLLMLMKVSGVGRAGSCCLVLGESCSGLMFQ
jgi:hypothetical protein